MKFKSIIMLCIVPLYLSCEKENINIEENVNKRLIFSDSKDFHETLVQLSEMQKPELIRWTKNKGYTSQICVEWNDDSDNDEDYLKNYPNAYIAILNTDYEYQIADTIVWFNQGKLYFVPNKDEILLKKIKNNPELCEITGTALISTRKEYDSENLKTVYLGLNDLDARNQYVFYYLGNTGSKRKYVHELVSFEYYNYGFRGSLLYLRIKLEWWSYSRKKWRPAGEKRNISINVSGTTGGTWSSSNYNLNRNYYNTGDVSILLADGYPILTSGDWSISMQGRIYQICVADPNSGWANTGYNGSSYLW